MSDAVTLVLPAQEDFHQVAHLVVGGLAARLDLTYEYLEDLQVAVDALLNVREDDGEISVTVRVRDDAVHTTVGPFAASALAELEHDGDGLGLRRVLETVCDEVGVDERGDESWVELTKRIATPAGAAG